VKYAEDEDWEKEFGENFPIIILVCESKRTRYRVSQLVKKVMDRTYVDIYYQVITKDRIMLGTDMSKWPKFPLMTRRINIKRCCLPYYLTRYTLLEWI